MLCYVMLKNAKSVDLGIAKETLSVISEEARVELPRRTNV